MSIKKNVIVTLTTDFGLQDPYVGQLKGALLLGYHNILPIDLSHAIAPWDLEAAAHCLYDSYRYFPKGSIHLVVVDPGVGSARKLIAAAGNGYYFVAPDNGVLSLLLASRQLDKACCISPDKIALSAISSTFHGRDILAPAAARLAQGAKLEELGPSLSLQELVRLPTHFIEPIDQLVTRLKGHVVLIDHFGNVRTNFHLARSGIDPARLLAIHVGGLDVNLYFPSYSAAAPGELFFLIDSAGYLEIAMNKGNAAQRIRCAKGDALILMLSSTQAPIRSGMD